MRSLVFVSGWSRSKNSYSKLYKTKPKDLNIYFIQSKDVNLKDINSSLLDFMENNQITEADFSGHSVGGAIVMEFAAQHPEKVKRLFLLDSEGVPGSEKFQELFVNFAKTQVRHGHKKLTTNAKSVLNLFKSPFNSIRTAKQAHYSDLRDKLSKINIPTIILWGEDDTLTPLWQGGLMHKGIKNSKLIILKNMDHDWPLHRPDLFWENF